jgi:hypothetical protein
MTALLGLPSAALLGLDTHERRRSRRETVQIDAQIVSDDLWCVVDCVICDRSDHGARLRLPWSIRLPARFELWIPEEKIAIPVRSVWRRGRLAGVEFTGAAKARLK